MHSLRGDVNQQTGRRWPALPLIALAFLLVATATPMLFGSDRGDDISRIQNADEVFKAIMNTPDKAIPQELLESAKCIAIIPGEVKAGFMFPAFLTVAGGSVGFQIGASSTDVVMIFRNNQGLARLLSDKFKIGADATAAAGPVGRTASAGTDLEMHAEILTYARSRGAFAGVSLNGAVVKADHSGDRALYGRRVMREQILDGQVRVPRVAEPLVAEITHYAAGTRTVASSR
jgi:lipid-binding SYLF domain-containing protein